MGGFDFKAECGDELKFDQAFMAWLKDAKKRRWVRLLMNGFSEQL
jgi:hypothetical protein